MRKEKIIYTYFGLDYGTDHGTAYYIYDPETGKHHQITKEQYEEVMKNAH